MADQKETRPPSPFRTWLSGLFFLTALESLLCGWLLFQIPGDGGLSLPRLILSLIFLAGLGGSVILALRLLRHEPFAKSFISLVNCQHARLSILFAIGTALMWAAVFLPPYRVGDFTAYFERLKPLFLWSLLVSIQFLVSLAFLQLREQKKTKWSTSNRKLIILSAVIFAAFSALLIFIALTRWGISPSVEFWEKTGAPILAGQVFIAWSFALVLLLCGKARPTCSHWSKINIDLCLFLLIWIISAVLWVQEPMQFNHFNPGPFPPNEQFYPNSDAETYDLAAQRALLGKDPGYVDKPFYSTLLLGFHLLAGQDINQVINLQTTLLAVFPALIYLLGTYLHNRTAGLVAALFAIFKELNAIQAQSLIWKTSTPKLMMSEFTNAVLLALLILFLWKWFSQEKKISLSALAASGVLGLAVLTRHNNWLFLPLILGLIVLVYWKRKKILLINSVMFVAMFFTTISPWMVYSQQHYGEALPFMKALTGAVLKNRINPLFEEPAPTPQPETFLPSGPAVKTASSSINIAYTGTVQPILQADTPDQPIILHPVIDALTRHFFHNLVSTTLTLPVTPVIDDIETTIRSSEVAHIWELKWKGRLAPHQLLILLLNLLLVSIGLAQSWQRWRLAGLAPFIIMLGYLLATAVAATSGGRYIVPIDWVIYVYYALGIVRVLEFILEQVWGINLPEPVQTACQQKNWHLGAVAAGFLFIGLLPAIAMSAFPAAYPSYNQQEIIESVLKTNQSLDQNALSPLVTAVQNEDLVVIHGKLLHPKYLDFKDDRSYEVNINDGKKGVPSLIFNVLGMQDEFLKGQLVMEVAPPPIINGSEAVVFACPGQEIAYALVLLDKQHERQLFLHPDWLQINCAD